MSKYIVCPNCGELVNKDDCKTTFKLFYAYKTCSNCDLKFTKLNKRINIFIYSYLFILLAIMVVALCIIVIYHYDELTQNSTSVNIFMYLIFILGVIGIANNAFSYLLSKKTIEHSNNGFLPIVEDKRQIKLISFVNEKAFSNDEKRSLSYFPIIKENAIILLPYPNIIMKIRLNEKTCLKKLQLYNVYKIIHNSVSKFVILTDYKFNNDHDEIVLYLKKFDQHEITNHEIYDIITPSNEFVCSAFVDKNSLF